MVMNAMLKKLGYRGETAKDGMEAVKASWRQKFELILMVAFRLARAKETPSTIHG